MLAPVCVRIAMVESPVPHRRVVRLRVLQQARYISSRSTNNRPTDQRVLLPTGNENLHGVKTVYAQTQGRIQRPSIIFEEEEEKGSKKRRRKKPLLRS
ncbi:hypothetical protein SETIT_2G285700v2 [Setaria italica]|uniref:Uncharacterized protein n=1 Tax=Setaria italica TaxID=4555 RepID=A0A368Q3R0_SETIT|nr:hypothetical protein SETIT_2G285700v2 [Setaria italica]